MSDLLAGMIMLGMLTNLVVLIDVRFEVKQIKYRRRRDRNGDEVDG